MRLTIRNKLLVILTGVAVLSAGVSAFLGYASASRALEEQTYSQLTVVRETKAGRVEDYFQNIVDQTVAFSSNRMIVDAAVEFRRAFNTVGRQLNIGQARMDEADLRLRMYYQQEFLPRLEMNLGQTESLSGFWPQSRQARILQDIYIASNPFDTGSKDELDNPSRLRHLPPLRSIPGDEFRPRLRGGETIRCTGLRPVGGLCRLRSPENPTSLAMISGSVARAAFSSRIARDFSR
jgi:hypothetical protein